MRLTDSQRRGLTLCASRPTRAILPGHKLDRLEVSYTTAFILIGQQYAQTIPRPQDEPAHVAAILVVTTAGRAALAVPVEDVARYLAARPGSRGDYTTIKALAASSEPEPVDDETLARFTKQSHRIRDLRDLGDVERARVQVLQAIQAAERTDVEHHKLRPVLKRLRANLADLERQLKRAA